VSSEFGFIKSEFCKLETELRSDFQKCFSTIFLGQGEIKCSATVSPVRHIYH